VASAADGRFHWSATSSATSLRINHVRTVIVSPIAVVTLLIDSAAMASQPPAQGSGDTTAASKVAIPRLEGRHGKKQEKPRKPKPPPNSRTQRACDNCRKRKVRCTGEPEQCRNCVEQGAICVYSMARRDRFKEYVHVSRIAGHVLARC
jgi:hypothetical protein